MKKSQDSTFAFLLLPFAFPSVCGLDDAFSMQRESDV
jgi:hypothetical protein